MKVLFAAVHKSAWVHRAMLRRRTTWAGFGAKRKF